MSNENPDVVYLVHWLSSDENDHHVVKNLDRDDACFIGVYSNKKNAEDAVKRAKQLPGFKDYPELFVISEFTIDTDQWTCGVAFI